MHDFVLQFSTNTNRILKLLYIEGYEIMKNPTEINSNPDNLKR